jgi:hypothetical protein
VAAAGADDGSWWSASWSGSKPAPGVRLFRKSLPADQVGCQVVQGKVPTAGAWAQYSQTMNKTGWAKINVVSNSNGFTDAEQAYLAGCLEGSHAF